MMMILPAAALALAGPGEERAFGDWVVACDNVKRCEAILLMPIDWDGHAAPGFEIVREAGPAGALTMAISPVSKGDGVTDILIDRRLMGSGVLRDGTIRLNGATAEGIARAMTKGRVMTLRQRRGLLATLSLTGSSAALRHIDAEQGRAGTLSALVARGPRPTAAVPAALPVPRIQAVRPGKGRPATLPAARIDALRAQSGCDGDRVLDGVTTQFHRLDARSTLVAVPCVSGAHQNVYVLFVAVGERVERARFDVPPLQSVETTAAPSVIEPEWDSAGVLSSRARGSGLGDCGTSQKWVWDGARFRMTAYEAMETCRPSGRWLTRYRAEPVWKSR